MISWLFLSNNTFLLFPDVQFFNSSYFCISFDMLLQDNFFHFFYTRVRSWHSCPDLEASRAANPPIRFLTVNPLIFRKPGAGTWNLTFVVHYSPNCVSFWQTGDNDSIRYFSPCAVSPWGQWHPHVSVRSGDGVCVRIGRAPSLHEHQVGKKCARLLHPPFIWSGSHNFDWCSKGVA